MSDIERRIADFLREEAEEAPRPHAMHERVLRRARAGRAVTAGIAGLALCVVVIAGVAAAGLLRSPSTIDPAGLATPTPSATTREVRGCPLTIPPQPAFVPPSPYPSRYPNPNVPESDDRQWYGTPALWTALPADGGVWQDLPDEDGNGKFFEKTFWWSESRSPESPISVTGRRLDEPGSFETGGPGGGGFRHDVRSFMLVGIEVPAGCWEITATYRGTELSYVVLVED